MKIQSQKPLFVDWFDNMEKRHIRENRENDQIIMREKCENIISRKTQINVFQFVELLYICRQKRKMTAI